MATEQGAEQAGGISVGEHLQAHIPGLPAPFDTLNLDTVINTWFVMALLLVAAFVYSRRLSRVPTRPQTMIEGIVEFSQGLVRAQIGPQTAKYLPFIGGLFVFILTSNWLGMLPWAAWEGFHLPWIVGHGYHAPTADINTTAGLALLSFASYFYFGIRKKGLGYFKHYLQPAPWLLPFVVLEDLTRPLSLALRLFANVTAGHVVIAVLLALAPWFVPIPIMGLDLFIGAIQAYIFAVLSASYIGAAVHEAH